MPKFESSSDGKEKREVSSQQNDIDDMLDKSLGLIEDDDQRLEGLDPDRDGLDKRAELEIENAERRDEPTVQVRDEKVEDVEPDDNTPLGKALKAIERQAVEIETLKSQMAQPRETSRREPEVVDMVEVLPGLKLPKDRNRWPVKITDQDLVRQNA